MSPPVLTPAQVKAVDERALEREPLDVMVCRAALRAGALLAQGMPPLHAAAAAAHLHGRAGTSGPSHGLVASDLLDLIPGIIGALSQD